MSTDKPVRKLDMDPLWLLRIFTVIPALLILLAGLGAIWIYFFTLSLLPEGHSVVDIPELQANVQVVRDSNGIPGILGENEEDVAMVFGYVMAQDRLWQMDYLRRAAQGRLAEILGPDYVDGDHLMRTIRAGMQSDQQLSELGEKERNWLTAFVRGVNRYIARHARKPPVEFSFLEYRPEPFAPEDALDICTALAWQSSRARKIDPAITAILGHLGRKRALPLLPTDPAVSPALVTAGLKNWQPRGLLFFSPLNQEPLAIRFPALRGGAAWAVGSANTVSGKPMSACSIYQDLAAPDFWYRARLAARDFVVSGAFLPGVPIAVAGNNGHLGWGCVTAPVDDADLYIEKVDSDSPTQYWHIDRWRNLLVSKQMYRIRGGSSVTRNIRLTHAGPLVSDVWQDNVISIRWTGQGRSGLFSTLYALNRAHGHTQVTAALKRLVAPCLNVVWTDDDGNFGTQLAGRVPIRPPQSDGIVPMPSWTGVHDWRGYIPFDELPSQTNPSDILAVVADGRPGGPDYPLFTGCYWSSDERRRRVRELVGRSDEHYRESFQQIQADTYSGLAQQMTPVLLATIKANQLNSSAEQIAYDLLGSWDFHMKRESAGAAVFGLVFRSLVEELFSEQLGRALYRQFADCHPVPARIVRNIFLKSNAPAGLSVDRSEVLLASFHKGVAMGRTLLGDDPKTWKWGDIHKTVFRHPLTARSRFLELLYEVGPLSVPGSQDTIDHSGWSSVHPFVSLEGVSLRHVSDMTEPPQVFAVSSMGSSAHFFSSHYKDQLVPWVNGRSLRDPVARADIRKNGFNAVLFRAGNQKS